MFITRKNAIRIVTPFALVGALVFTGCSASAPADTTDSVVEVETETDDASTDFEVVAENTIMTGDEALDAQLAKFSEDLTASKAPGVSRILINAYTADSVGIQVWTDDSEGILTGEQLKPVLDAIQALNPVTPVGEFQINGWDVEGMQGESSGAAEELGVKAEFIDTSWWTVTIPGDQVQNIFA